MHGAKAAVALAQDAPWLVLADKLAADQLGIADDAVGAEMHEVVGLRARVATPRQRLRQHDAAASVAARIEQQNVVIVERPLEPAVLG